MRGLDDEGGNAAFFEIIGRHFEADVAAYFKIGEFEFQFFVGVGDDDFSVGQGDAVSLRAEAFGDGASGGDGFGGHGGFGSLADVLESDKGGESRKAVVVPDEGWILGLAKWEDARRG